MEFFPALADQPVLTLEGFFYLIYWLFAVVRGNAVDPMALQASAASFAQVWSNVSTVVSLLFVVGILYSTIRTTQIHVEEKHHLHEDRFPDEIAAAEAAIPQPGREKWERVIAHITSENSSDWRLAILEADIILEELLAYLGYSGDTVGEMLKSADPGEFKNIDIAWEAHKVRNAIAHQGAEFEIPQREARRVVGLFETVFREFDYI